MRFWDSDVWLTSTIGNIRDFGHDYARNWPNYSRNFQIVACEFCNHMQNLIIISMAKLCTITYLLSSIIFLNVWPHFTVKNTTSLYGTIAYAKNALEDALKINSRCFIAHFCWVTMSLRAFSCRSYNKSRPVRWLTPHAAWRLLFPLVAPSATKLGPQLLKVLKIQALTDIFL